MSTATPFVTFRGFWQSNNNLRHKSNHKSNRFGLPKIEQKGAGEIQFWERSCSKSSAHHSAFASARLMALRRLVAGRALDFEQISKEDYQKISKVSLAFENKWKLLGMGQSKEKVKYAFFSLRLLLTWLGCVWWSCQIDFSSCQMEKKKGTAFSKTWQNTLGHMT